jgi:hypothetical protein
VGGTEMTTSMKLYIISDVLRDYSAGMVVIAANDLEDCRNIYQEKFGTAYDFDQSIKKEYYTELNVSDVNPGVIDYVYGGG